MFLFNVNAYYVSFMGCRYNKPSANKVDQCLWEVELQTTSQESRGLGSLYCFVRSGDNLVFENPPINREIQLLLGNVLLDEYGRMEPI